MLQNSEKNNSSNLSDIQYTVIYDKEKQQIITFDELKPENVLHLCLKYDRMNPRINQLSRLIFCQLTSRLID